MRVICESFLMLVIFDISLGGFLYYYYYIVALGPIDNFNHYMKQEDDQKWTELLREKDGTAEPLV